MGHPMSHSTQFGFNPIPWIFCPPALIIVHRILWSNLSFSRESPVFRVRDATFVPLYMHLVGVGQLFTTSASPVCPLWFVVRRPACAASDALGVGNNPNPVASVGRSGVNRSEHSPFRIVPHFGQVSKNGSESSRNEKGAVFNQDPFWLNLANDPCHFAPQARSFSRNPGSLSGG